MQDIIFYAVANGTLGVVRDYANARNKPAPVLALGVSVRLRLRLFAGPNTAMPYPAESFNTITDWQWSMDGDFDRTTACKLVADANGISVHTVTDTINGETMNFTEIVIPISNMNTVELAAWIGAEKTRSGLTGELVGYDGENQAAFVLQIENFTVRNRVAGLGDPTALDQETLTRTQAVQMIESAVSSSAATKQDKLTAANGGTGISVTNAGVISVSNVPQSAVAGLSASFDAKQDNIAAGDLVELSGATVNRRRYMAVRQLSDMATVSRMPTGSTVNRTYRIMEPGNAYKLTAVNSDLYLATADAFQRGNAAMQWGIESHIELFVAGAGRLHTDANVILADALEPDAVNNCTVRFHNGRAIISVEDHLAGSIVTVNASTSAEGSLKYYLEQAPAADATYNETQYIAVDASLNGQMLDLAGVITNGEKHVVGNGYSETVLTGGVSCTSKTTFSNLSMNGVSVLAGTMTLGDVCISSGATVRLSGGTFNIENVSGPGNLDFGGSYLIMRSSVETHIAGCTVTNGARAQPVLEVFGGNLFLTNALVKGNSNGGVYLSQNNPTSATVTITNSVLAGNASRHDIVIQNGIIDIYGSTVDGVYPYAGKNTFNITGGTNRINTYNGAGALFVSSGAVFDFTGNNGSSHVISVTSGITFLPGCATVLTGATAGVAASAYTLGGMTVPRIGNTNIVNLNGSNVMVLSGGTAYASGCEFVSGGINIPQGTVVTIVGSSGSSGYFSDLAMTGSTITGLGRIYGATVTVPPLEDPLGSRGPWTLETTEGQTTVSAVSGESQEIVVAGGLYSIIGM